MKSLFSSPPLSAQVSVLCIT